MRKKYIALFLVVCLLSIGVPAYAQGGLSLTVLQSGAVAEALVGYRVMDRLEVIGGLDYSALSLAGEVNGVQQTRTFPVVMPRVGLRYYLSSKQLAPYLYGTVGSISRTEDDVTTGVKLTARVTEWSLGVGADYAFSDALSLCGQYGINSVAVSGEFSAPGTSFTITSAKGEIGLRQTSASLGMKFKF